MTFDEAVTLMRKGKVVARRSSCGFAQNRGIGVQFMDHGPVRFATVRNGSFCDHYAAGYDDATATDWEVVDAINPNLDKIKLFAASAA